MILQWTSTTVTMIGRNGIMNVRRGDVVLVDYLFSDRTGSKVRPCLVVQNNSNNARLDDTIVAIISSNTARGKTSPRTC